MKKNTLAAIFAAISLAGGAVVISQVDSSRFKNAIPASSNHVDLGRTVSRTQLRTALSNAANYRDYDINFNEVYKKGYRLGSVEETSNYQWTKVNVLVGPMQWIELIIHGDTKASLYVRPFGFVSDSEIRQYLNALSKHLPKRE